MEKTRTTKAAPQPNRQARRHSDYVTLKQALIARPWLTERWLRRKVAEKRIAYAKADGILLFSLEDIDSFVEASRVEPA